MKICDVVMNSVWHDPRVRKQVEEYIRYGEDVVCVGYECKRYDKDKINHMPCKTVVVRRDKRFEGKQKNLLKKFFRENVKNQSICNAIAQENPDLIHANDLDALIPAYMASKKTGAKIVYDSHEVYVKNNNFKGRPFYSKYLEIKERFICKQISQMICVSNSAADYFMKKYHIARPLVITNCTLKDEQIRDNTILKRPGFEVLNHGQFYSGRGFEEMVEASILLKKYPDIKLCIRGLGNLEQYLHERAATLHADNCVFYPPVDVERLISEAARSHVGVALTKPICLNFKLSVSNRLFEYAAAGLPVIMSDIPEHRYLNNKYHFGLILPDDSPTSLATAIIQLYKDADLYSRLAKNSRKMSEEINWENEFGKLIAIEEHIVEDSVSNE